MWRCVLLGASGVLLGCQSKAGDSGVALEDCRAERWVGAWAAAPSGTTEAVADETLRLVFTPLRSGETARVRLSNRFGDGPLTVDSVVLGVQSSGAAVHPDSQKPVTFDGASSVTLQAGEDRFSDPVEQSLVAMEPLALSLHVPSATVALTRHQQGHQTSFSAPGNVSADPSDAPFTGSRTDRPLLMGLDVLAEGSAGVVAALGDSLTDGNQAGPESIDADTRYPDGLARRLLDAGSSLSPVNLGIGGNRVRSDAALPDFGPALLDRLEAYLLSRDDVTDVLLLIGANDLGIPPGTTADELLDGLTTAVDIIKARPGAPRVHVGTLTPAGGASGIYSGYADAEPIRAEVNEAIRAGTVSPFVIDFDAALRDPAKPTHLRPEYESPDGLHLSAAGYAAMAEAVPLDALRGRRCAD